MIDEAVPDILDSTAAGSAAVRGGTLRVGGYILNAVLGAVAAAFLFRQLGPDGAGRYVLVMSIITIVGGLSDLGLTALGVRELSVRAPAERRVLMSNLLGLRIVFTFCGVAVALLFSLGVGYASVVITGVVIAGLALLLQTLQTTLALSFMSQLRLGWVTAGEVARQAGLTVLIVLFVELGGGFLTFISLQIPVAIVLLVLTAVLVRGDVPLRPSFHRGELRLLAGEMLPYSVAAALAVIYFRVSVIAVSLISGARELGYFSASFRILEVLVGIPGLMVTAAFPIFARSALDDHERFAYAVARVFDVALIVGVWFALSLGLGAAFAIDVVGGSAFRPAVGVLQIQAVGLGGSFVAAVWSVALLSLRRRRELVAISLVALVVGAVLVAVLASLHGARGAAVGTAITEVGLAVVGGFVLRRSGRHLVPSLRLLPRVALAAAAGCSVALVPGLGSVLSVVAATIIYFGLLLALRAVPEEVLGELRRRRSGAA